LFYWRRCHGDIKIQEQDITCDTATGFTPSSSVFRCIIPRCLSKLIHHLEDDNRELVAVQRHAIDINKNRLQYRTRTIQYWLKQAKIYYVRGKKYPIFNEIVWRLNTSKENKKDVSRYKDSVWVQSGYQTLFYRANSLRAMIKWVKKLAVNFYLSYNVLLPHKVAATRQFPSALFSATHVFIVIEVAPVLLPSCFILQASRYIRTTGHKQTTNNCMPTFCTLRYKLHFSWITLSRLQFATLRHVYSHVTICNTKQLSIPVAEQYRAKAKIVWTLIPWVRILLRQGNFSSSLFTCHPIIDVIQSSYWESSVK
jgi:hypothetical protein